MNKEWNSAWSMDDCQEYLEENKFSKVLTLEDLLNWFYTSANKAPQDGKARIVLHGQDIGWRRRVK
jgi:hypothetical protein